MLETLTQGFTAARERLSGVRELSDENVAEALRDVRMSLLEADVDLSVVRDFLDRVKQRALGEKVDTRVRDATGRMVRVTPGQHFVKACHEELVALIDSCFAASCADACRSPFEAFFAADATAAGLRDACLAKAKACPLDLYSWRCDDLGGIAEDRRADLQACLELPCGDVGASACFAKVYPCVLGT